VLTAGGCSGPEQGFEGEQNFLRGEREEGREGREGGALWRGREFFRGVGGGGVKGAPFYCLGPPPWRLCLCGDV